jgi:two-component system response regulator AtoC
VHGRADARLDSASAQLLEDYSWPGNVRELKNAIEHALVFASDSTLTPQNFPAILGAAPQGAGSLAGLSSLEDMEKDAIRATLEATHFKIARSAEILGISRKTLLDKRKKYGLI